MGRSGATATFKRGFGHHHPLWAFVDHGPDGTGEPVAALLRAGNAGSNTAGDHLRVIRAALRQLPGCRAGRRPGKKVLIRVDGAGATHELLDWLAFRRVVSATRGGTPAGADDLRFQVAQAAEQRGRRLQPLVRCTPHHHTYPMMSPGLTWASATGWGTVEAWVDSRLSSRWGAAEGADFDQEGLCAKVREVVNDNLPAGWTLAENQFVGPTPIPEDTPGIIHDVIDEIDFWGMAQYYDNGD